MDDKIPVNYDILEQLFCQKQIENAQTGAPAKQVPTKVLSDPLEMHNSYISALCDINVER